MLFLPEDNEFAMNFVESDHVGQELNSVAKASCTRKYQCTHRRDNDCYRRRRKGGAGEAGYYRLQVDPRKLGQRQA